MSKFCPHCGDGLPVKSGKNPAPSKDIMHSILRGQRINPIKARSLKFVPYMGNAGSLQFTIDGDKREIAVIFDGVNWEYDEEQGDEDDADEYYDRPMRIYYKFPGSFHAQGPTTKRFMSQKEAQDYLEELLGDEWSDDIEFWPTN